MGRRRLDNGCCVLYNRGLGERRENEDTETEIWYTPALLKFLVSVKLLLTRRKTEKNGVKAFLIGTHN